MNRIVVASIRRNSGKTSVIVGLGKKLGGKIGYMKPFGDRLLYKKKQLWDHDAALMVSLFGIEEDASSITIGFEQQKLRYMFTEETLNAKLNEMAGHLETDKDMLFVEAGKDFSYGCSVNMDPISITKSMGAKLLVVISGDEASILDDSFMLKTWVDNLGLDLMGVIINKVPNIDDFKEIYLPEFQKLEIPVLGVIPYEIDFKRFKLDFLVEKLMAKVLSGGDNLDRIVKTVFVGAMSADAAMRHPLFQKEDRMIITAGDRADMLLAALDSDAAAVLLTNNILPPPNIISKFKERDMPLLLTQQDTYSAAMTVNRLHPLLTAKGVERIKHMEELIEKHVDLEAIRKG